MDVQRFLLLAMAGVFSLGVGLSVAQQSPQLALSANAATVDPDAPNKEAIAKMPDAEKLSKSKKMITGMRGLQGSTQDLLQKAREDERSIGKINCINEKLLLIKGFVNVSEESYAELKSAAAKKDSAATAHRYTLVALADYEVKKLAEDAKLCVGDIQRTEDLKARDVDVANDIADVDPVQPDGRLTPDELRTELYNPGKIIELTPFQ